MPKSNPTLIERGNEADKSLANRYDQLNQLWTTAETKLRAIKAPHDVWVEYNRKPESVEYGPPADGWDLLGFVKHEGNWRIVHAVDADFNDGPPASITPIIECSSQIRIDAAPVLAKLHAEIVKTKHAYIKKAQEAIEQLTIALSGMQ